MVTDSIDARRTRDRPAARSAWSAAPADRRGDPPHRQRRVASPNCSTEAFASATLAQPALPSDSPSSGRPHACTSRGRSRIAEDFPSELARLRAACSRRPCRPADASTLAAAARSRGPSRRRRRRRPLRRRRRRPRGPVGCLSRCSSSRPPPTRPISTTSTAISPGFTNGATVAQALKTGAAYEPERAAARRDRLWRGRRPAGPDLRGRGARGRHHAGPPPHR